MLLFTVQFQSPSLPPHPRHSNIVYFSADVKLKLHSEGEINSLSDFCQGSGARSGALPAQFVLLFSKEKCMREGGQMGGWSPLPSV